MCATALENSLSQLAMAPCDLVFEGFCWGCGLTLVKVLCNPCGWGNGLPMETQETSRW